MNINDFSFRLKNLLWSNEVLLLLPGFGWNDGGCRSLMKAIGQWLGKENVGFYQLVKEPNQSHSEHVFVKVGNWFIDGNGVSGEFQMKYTWLVEERMPSVLIIEFDPANEPDASNGDKPYYINEESIKKIVLMLEETFDKNEVLTLLK